MRREAFLLGFLATAGQVLLLRELVTAFGGTELFIGTALFGWLIWVALGALIGGQKGRWNLSPLFAAAVLVLPLSLVGVRLMPLSVTDVIGEMIPLTTAAPLTMLAVAPVGLLSGLLFPVIARQGRDSGQAITLVYLYEGFGAFAAGVVTVALISLHAGNLGIALAVGGVVALVVRVTSNRGRRLVLVVSGAMLFLLGVSRFGATFDEACDRIKFAGYTVERSFDTPYGHQTILTRDRLTVLVTDNTIEAIHPDLERAENLLIPPLVYVPSPSSLLFFGRSEFGLGQLAAQFPNLRITAVDPRSDLVGLGDETAVARIVDDPGSFLSRSEGATCDLVILGLPRLDSYRSARFVTAEFLQQVRRRLNPQGVLLLATSYDTDRYISTETGEALGMIARTVREVFPHMTVWPGTATLILASEACPLDLSVDSILARVGLLPYRPEYISDVYLGERLNEFKRSRVEEVLYRPGSVNSIAVPALSSIEVWHRSRASDRDRAVAEMIYGQPLWVWTVPVGIVVLFFWSLRGRRPERAGLFIYFSVGLVSLTLELISFYLFQSTAGSLHYHLAALIGAFMLGLSLGAWLGLRAAGFGVGILAATTLLAATVLFAFTWRAVDAALAPAYHGLFLMLVALSTGALFATATRMYGSGSSGQSRGTGYALELAGSAVGALLTNAVLLPIAGVDVVLASLALVVSCMVWLVAGFGRFGTR